MIKSIWSLLQTDNLYAQLKYVQKQTSQEKSRFVISKKYLLHMELSKQLNMKISHIFMDGFLYRFQSLFKGALD